MKQVKQDMVSFQSLEIKSFGAVGEVTTTVDTYEQLLNLLIKFPEVEKASMGSQIILTNGRAGHSNGLFINRFTTGR